MSNPDRTYQAAVGRRLTQERWRRGWTINELATRTPFNAAAISQWERGVRNMRVEDLAAIADALDANVTEFLPEKAGAWWAM